MTTEVMGQIRTVFALIIVVVATAAAGDVSEMATVAAGEYPIGEDTGPIDSRPAHTVMLEPFLIDRHEVTNAQFVRFLDSLDVVVVRDASAGHARRRDVEGADADVLFGGTATEPPLIELDDEDARIALVNGLLTPEPGFENHPVTEVTWFGAQAYCRWRDARLPTEAEWEAAARGKEGRLYPWGDAAPNAELAVFTRPRGQTLPVGSRPAGATPEGVHDLAGSLAEWTSSLYRPYPYDPIDGREDPDAPGERVTRGGDYIFDDSPEALTTFFRSGFSRAVQHGHRHIGLRCVKSL
ncbi:MAG: formylglycine-generating enzyme family protein [Gammaproteobacteria bacterium]|nr:formylglycine-generating enzyme family protein [Gammaproteobacteria bacterium]